MEYFDPKTRPHSIFLDDEALLATPPHLIRSTAATVFAGSVAAKGQLDSNPLVEGDDDQAFRLAYRACRRLPDEPRNPSLLIDLGVAAFLRNRAEDDGMSRLLRGPTFSGNYAISTALHIRYPRIGQGESTSAIHAARIRASDAVDVRGSAKKSPRHSRSGATAWMAAGCARRGRQARRSLHESSECRPACASSTIPREDFPKIAADTVKNFNANAGGSLTGEPRSPTRFGFSKPLTEEAQVGPLAGLRIVELGGIGPGPFASMLFSEMGAEVLRISRLPSAGEGIKGFDKRYQLLNRGRRTVAMDLKNPRAIAAVKRLIAGADAVIEGFRPGVAERLGLGPDDCLRLNPKLVYGRITGWGQDGPLAAAPGTRHQLHRPDRRSACHWPKDGPPVPPLNLVGDFGGGAMYLAFGMVCAILEARGRRDEARWSTRRWSTARRA